MLNSIVDTWFVSKQSFFQVISLGSKKPVLLCFFRDWWVRLPAELERLPVWYTPPHSRLVIAWEKNCLYRGTL